jgi:hypothetical protein
MSNRCAAKSGLKDIVNKAIPYFREMTRRENSVFPTHRAIFADGTLQALTESA